MRRTASHCQSTVRFAAGGVRLRSGFILARPVDPKLTFWLASIAGLAALNIGLWIWIAHSASHIGHAIEESLCAC
jgi:hypothetical protein